MAIRYPWGDDAPKPSVEISALFDVIEGDVPPALLDLFPQPSPGRAWGNDL